VGVVLWVFFLIWWWGFNDSSRGGNSWNLFNNEELMWLDLNGSGSIVKSVLFALKNRLLVNNLSCAIVRQAIAQRKTNFLTGIKLFDSLQVCHPVPPITKTFFC